MTKYYVYAIGFKNDLIYPYKNCYVGVTKDLKERWKSHTKSKYTVGNFIRTYDLSIEDNMIVLYEGSSEECFDIEEKYRPLPFMGLNEASGGCGGYTSYSQERNVKISKANKGRIKTSEEIEKMSKSKKGQHSGAKNPMSKKWMIKDPYENVYIIEGTLATFCNDNNILESCLRQYKNKIVPKPNYNGYGGYRIKNSTSKNLRENTIGWSLYEMKKEGKV
jgi:hypothetical protein